MSEQATHGSPATNPMNDGGIERGKCTARESTILGVPFDDVTVDEAIDRMAGWLATEPGELHQVATANPEFVVATRRDDRFRSILQSADLVTPDGIGILIGSRILGRPLHHRVTGVDLVEGLSAREDQRFRLFLLGAGPGIANRAAQRLRERYAGVIIAGVWEGSPEPADAGEILERIRQARATILLVAYGAPKQDVWIDTYRNQLAACGIVIAIGIGGTLDYLAGAVPRAPRWVRRCGFEWLFRLIRQPWRWRRQLALPLFGLLVMSQRLRVLRADKLEHKE